MDVIVFTLAAVHTVSYCPVGNPKQTTKSGLSTVMNTIQICKDRHIFPLIQKVRTDRAKDTHFVFFLQWNCGII